MGRLRYVARLVLLPVVLICLVLARNVVPTYFESGVDQRA